MDSPCVSISRRTRGSKPKRQVKGQLAEAGLSVGGFLCGLLLASLYGCAALLLQGGALWFCVYSTAAIALLASFSMGLSASTRANVMLMLPTLLSVRGRMVLVSFVLLLLLSGPLANILLNFERAADSLVCGAELAQNHTQEVMKRSAAPLMPVLQSIRELTSNARSVSGRVHHFITALTDNTRHIARTLRNVLHFLVDIGDVCNDRMGRPYRKCIALFDTARVDCSRLLGVFNFLCDIVEGFRPLCGLARAGQMFCVIPAYVGEQLKKRLAAPAVGAFARLKAEFEFSVSADVTFDLEVNGSQSVQRAAQDLLRGVALEVGRLRGWGQLLTYLGVLVLALAYLKAARYRQQYLHQDEFDNAFITEQFEEEDERRASEGGASVLPLQRREAGLYTSSGQSGSLDLAGQLRGLPHRATEVLVDLQELTMVLLQFLINSSPLYAMLQQPSDQDVEDFLNQERFTTQIAPRRDSTSSLFLKAMDGRPRRRKSLYSRARLGSGSAANPQGAAAATPGMPNGGGPEPGKCPPVTPQRRPSATELLLSPILQFVSQGQKAFDYLSPTGPADQGGAGALVPEAEGAGVAEEKEVEELKEEAEEECPPVTAQRRPSAIEVLLSPILQYLSPALPAEQDKEEEEEEEEQLEEEEEEEEGARLAEEEEVEEDLKEEVEEEDEEAEEDRPPVTAQRRPSAIDVLLSPLLQYLSPALPAEQDKEEEEEEEDED
ncbi:DC-STAMP domain-containing protein 2-like [Gadus macrocephalus]|uniref:DC-STAMP domain-containing protein 2-like n=1 Tax=Gadus macrocephalus TaxID=80720 RepID=UPI0028CB3806|nr:DC-STAMP domain-containing protein 2-like [Gadus macrocephalus]